VSERQKDPEETQRARRSAEKKGDRHGGTENGERKDKEREIGQKDDQATEVRAKSSILSKKTPVARIARLERRMYVV